MRRIRLAAATVMVAAGLIGAVAVPASAAPPTTKSAQQLCLKAQGGLEFETDVGLYGCLAPLFSLSDRQVQTAQSLCEGAFKGVFSFEHSSQSLPIGDLWECESDLITP